MAGLIELRTPLRSKRSFCAAMSVNCESIATNWKSSNEKAASLVHFFLLQFQEIGWKLVAKWKINRKIEVCMRDSTEAT